MKGSHEGTKDTKESQRRPYMNLREFFVSFVTSWQAFEL
jgi:hypothetical protein